MFFLISPITFEFYDKTTFILKLFQWDIPDLFLVHLQSFQTSIQFLNLINYHVLPIWEMNARPLARESQNH